MHQTAYHKLRPEQLVRRRTQLPVAYIGLGILEWHGLHNPLGLDGLKADGIALRLSRNLGGVAMPPLYWGDHRHEICERHLDPTLRPEGSADAFDHAKLICRHMKLTKQAFAADAQRSIDGGGWALWETLMVHMLFQIETLGFRLIVPIPGHYPLIRPLRNAIRTYRRSGGTARLFPLADAMYADDLSAGDHAAAFETSLMLALEPELVDLGALDSDLTRPNVGVVSGKDPRTDATAEFGLRILQKFEDLVRQQIAHFVESEASG